MNTKTYDSYIKEILPKDVLIKDYCELFLNEKEIAQKYGLTECAVRKLIVIYDVHRDSKKAKAFKNHIIKAANYEAIKARISKNILYEWYVVNDNPYVDGPKHFNISQWSFDKLCKEYKIKKDRKKTCLKSVRTRETAAGGKSAYNLKVTQAKNTSVIAKYGSVSAYNQKRSNSLRKTWDINHKGILDKVNITKTENHSFNSSAPEDTYYTFLCQKYGSGDVVRQYSDDRYPYNCDFYIKSIDQFIELNLNWTHGGHPFDTTSKEDLYMLQRWKLKAETSAFYRNAIDVWTKRDIEKLHTAQNNNLNYKVYYNVKELYEG